MNILLCPGVYLPHQRAGSEIYLHKVAKHLLKTHDVRCIAHCPDGRYNFEGVEVYPVNTQQWQTDNSYLWSWADLVFTQLSGTYYVMNKMRVHQKKIINFAHNNGGYAQVPLRKNVYTVYNCENTAKELNYNQETFILPPPIYREMFTQERGEYITLVNHNENKGGKILIEIAKEMPDLQFMAIHGGYYEQIWSKEPNIKYVPLAEDIRPYLSQTRLIIAPSEYESYGQSCLEAMCCGIPVIATNLGGFRESLGHAGRFIFDRNDIKGWCMVIRDTLANYDAWSKMALERAGELTPDKDLADFEIWLNKINNLAWK